MSRTLAAKVWSSTYPRPPSTRGTNNHAKARVRNLDTCYAPFETQKKHAVDQCPNQPRNAFLDLAIGHLSTLMNRKSWRGLESCLESDDPNDVVRGTISVSSIPINCAPERKL